MFLFEKAPLLLGLWLLGGFAGVFYYGTMLAGWFKEPLLANFRRYGDEQRTYPLVNFLAFCGSLSLALGAWVSDLTLPLTTISGTMIRASLFMTGMVALGAALLAWKQPLLREALPRWYFELLRTSSRQERRFIGWAWLRIPRKMRWRLSSDQKAFRIWSDMVRITVIYGAYDPESAWDRWN
jgi:hypothetical protein